jgi:hypothetical protein
MLECQPHRKTASNVITALPTGIWTIANTHMVPTGGAYSVERSDQKPVKMVDRADGPVR